MNSTCTSPSPTLWEVCWSGDLRGVERMLARGVSPNTTVEEDAFGGGPAFHSLLGTPCLAFAAKAGHAEVVELLLAQPATQANLANREQETALHCALGAFTLTPGHTGVVRHLLALGPRLTCLNALDGFGVTALQYAVMFGAANIVKLFLSSELANLTFLDTQVDGRVRGLEVLARRRGHRQVAKMVEEAGRRRRSKEVGRSLVERAGEGVVASVTTEEELEGLEVPLTLLPLLRTKLWLSKYFHL